MFLKSLYSLDGLKKKIMQVINKETGKDITNHVLAYLEKKITKDEFEQLTGLSKDDKLC